MSERQPRRAEPPAFCSVVRDAAAKARENVIEFAMPDDNKARCYDGEATGAQE